MHLNYSIMVQAEADLRETRARGLEIFHIFFFFFLFSEKLGKHNIVSQHSIIYEFFCI